uniref:Uncharacterized protein n=1 Tax=viral metagenome TaxID=1070528 RepID=A0A6C0DX23_9ZZZZ
MSCNICYAIYNIIIIFKSILFKTILLIIMIINKIVL